MNLFRFITICVFLAACINPLRSQTEARLAAANIPFASGQASRSDILAARVFEQPIVTLGASAVGEDAALGDALRGYVIGSDVNDYAPLESFLVSYPDSVYAAFLHSRLAKVYYQQGRYSKSLAASERAWLLSRGNESVDGRRLAADSGADLGRMLSRVGRVDELRALLAEPASQRPMMGRAAEQFAHSRTALWMMTQRPGSSFRCGSLALANVSRTKGASPVVTSVFESADSPGIGFSLYELETLASQAGMPQKAVYVDQTAAVPVPSVVHWRIGHYAAIIDRKGDTFRLRDPTFGEGRDVIVGLAALREEASGFFLVDTAAALQPGWRQATTVEKDSTRGRGQTYGNNPSATRADDHIASACGSGSGMAVATVKSMLVSLHLRDVPLFYSTPYGPEMSFALHYNERENNEFSEAFANFGPRWSFSWIGWVNEEGGGLPPAGPNDYPTPFTLAAPLGGQISYDPLSDTPGPITGPELFRSGYDSSQAVRQSPGHYMISYPDGSRREFAHPVGVTSSRPVLLTRVYDPAGNYVQINYDSNHRIDTIVDAQGGTTQFDYHPTLTRRILRIHLPDGRMGEFSYTATGLLQSITDASGIVSSFGYVESTRPDRVTSLETPYGVTRFRFGETEFFDDPTRYRWIETTDPLGNRERVEFNERSDIGIPDAEPWNQGKLPNMPLRNIRLNARNTFIWSKKAFSLASNLSATSADNPANTTGLVADDYAVAEVYHWLHVSDLSEAILESTKKPGEERLWFNYPDQDLVSERVTVIGGVQPPGLIIDEIDYSDSFKSLAYPVYSDRATSLGSSGVTLPSRIGRVVPDPSGAVDANGAPVLVSQVQSFSYNDQGRLLRERDADGRERRHSYAANGLDLIKTEQLVARVPGNDDPNAWTWETLVEIDWNSGVPHRPRAITDASRQTTEFTYNSAGQLRTLRNARNETTTYWYHPTGQGVTPLTTLDPNARGYLVRVDGPLAGSADSIHFTWDAFGRVRTQTDQDGYATTTSYDNLDRVLRVTYPDTTYEEFDYGFRLDLDSYRDRSGRFTRYTYDDVGRLRTREDPTGAVSEWQWCGCGGLFLYRDALGNIVRYETDVNGRVSAVHREGGSPTTAPATFNYGYDIAGRLAYRTDARGQTTRYRHTRADLLSAIVHENPIEPTPDTFLIYDDMRPRIEALENRQGGSVMSRINYGYHPVTAPTGTLGAGQLASIDGPLADDTLLLGYDALGRVVSRSMPGQAETWQFDALGRISTLTNPLGTFTPGYAGPSGRLTSWSRTGGLNITTGYDPVVADLELSSITVRRPDNSLVMSIAQTIDPVRSLPMVSQEILAGVSGEWRYSYTARDELETAMRIGGPADGQAGDRTYAYDAVGNRLGAQSGAEATKWTVDGQNRYQQSEAGGWARFLFGFSSTPSDGVAFIQGRAAPIDTRGQAGLILPVVTGDNLVEVRAVVPGEGAVVRRQARLTVAYQPVRTYEHDANGNLSAIVAGGVVERFFRYDARDRLVAWGSGQTVEGRLVYDPLGRIARETDASGTAIAAYVWAGDVPAQRRLADNAVAARFFPQGEVRASLGNRYYARDLQGSVRAVTDATGNLVSSYSYDAYGKRSQISGSETHDIGYLGFVHHAASGLILAPSGAYHPGLGRWLQPTGDADNRYAFAGNAPPAVGRDPFGLMATGAYTSADDEDLFGSIGVGQIAGSMAASLIYDSFSRGAGGSSSSRKSGSASCTFGTSSPPGSPGGVPPPSGKPKNREPQRTQRLGWRCPTMHPL